MSKYDNIKTAAELVAEVRANGLSTDQKDICRAQDIFGHTPIEELDRLANDIGRDNDKGEPDPHGTWSSSRPATQATFYQIAFTIWHWEDAVRFWNQHTNPEHTAFEEVKAENARLRKAKDELEDQRDTLQHEQEMATREIESLRADERTMLSALEDAEAEVVNLKAELYDYIKALEGGVSCAD